MGKKRRILSAALLVGLLCGLGWWMLLPREPHYKGKALSVWLTAYNPSVFDGTSDAGAALRHIGTNAIPTLLRMLRASESPLKAKLIHLVDRQDLVNVHMVSAEDKNFEASAAFRVLGPDAINAVPELVKIYEEKISVASQTATADAIGGIGPAATNAIPALLRGLKTTNDAVREITISSLGEIHGEPGLVVPEPVKLLHDPRPHAGGLNAVYALGEYGTNARSAVQDLTGLLNDQDKFRRGIVTDALKRIDPEAAARAGVK